MSFWTMPLPGLMRKRGGAINIIGVAVEAGQTTHNRIDADGNTLSGSEYNFGGSYYATHGAFALADEVIDSQNMVRVPAMWYRRATLSSGPNSGKEAWWVADGPAPGFSRHPAFFKGGLPIPHFWVGKYQGVADGGTKLGSFGGTIPLDLIIGDLQGRIAARNAGGQSGWMMWSAYQLAVIQMLAMIETGSTDSQTAIGTGRVSAGSLANVNASDVAQATYRGVVGLWGNLAMLVDGLKTVSGVIHLWDRTGGKSWVSTGVSKSLNANTQTAMIGSTGGSYDFKDVFFPDAVASSGGAWRDYARYDNSGDKFPAFGGGASSGTQAGLWCAWGYLEANNTGAGARLAKEP